MKLFTLLFFALTPLLTYANSTIQEDFESLKPQTLGTLKTQYGEWKTDQNQASITTSHAYKGRQALQFAGGKNCTLDLVLAQPLSNNSFLNFSAQRFTSANPFKFDIFALNGTKKEKIFTSSTIPLKYEEITSVLVPAGTQALHFALTTPPGKGLFLDDFSIIPSGPMQIQRVYCTQKNIPMLIGADYNDLLTVNLQTLGLDSPLVVKEATFIFQGDRKHVKSFEIHAKTSAKTQRLATVPMPQENEFKVDLNLPLGINKNELVVKVILDEKANINETLDMSCKSVVLTDGQSLKIENPSPEHELRIGHLLRAPKQDNCASYRIPGIVTTKKGTLLAVYDNRYNSAVDLQEDVDVGLSRSTDGGQTWEKMKVIMDMGTFGNKPERENGIGDPAIMYDPINDVIWVAALWAHGQPGKRTWFASGKGLEPEQTGQFVLVKSEDDGVTWSEPINITKQVKDPSWTLFFQGPGMGITMRNGTLVFPAQFKDQNHMPYSTLIYSKDKGKTWKAGTGAKANTTEAQIVELNDGSLMLNMRDNRGGFRSIATTKNLGKTWEEHPTSRKALIEPVCMGSIIRASSKNQSAKQSVLLFSNPNTSNGRHHMGIKYSTDEGKTWSEGLIYDERHCDGYSCLTMIDDKTVGILYEGRSSMLFQAIKLKDIMKKK